MRRTSERGSFSGGFTGCFGVLAAVVVVVALVAGFARGSGSSSPATSKPGAAAALPTDVGGLAICQSAGNSSLVGMGGAIDTFLQHNPDGVITYDVQCSASNRIADIVKHLPATAAADVKATLALPATGLVPGDSSVTADNVYSDGEALTYHSALLSAALLSHGDFAVYLVGASGHYDPAAVSVVTIEALP